MFKKFFFWVLDILLSRKQVIHLSKAMLNRALGNNNGDLATNGESSLIRQVLSFKKDSARDKFIIFDVGANVGEWTDLLLHIAEEQGREEVSVHCFEPSRFTFARLQSTLQKFGGEKVQLVNSGMGNMKESKELYITHDAAGTNSLYKRRLEGLDVSYGRIETIQITTVDTYCRENDISHIDFLKIDVEGHELAVMQGAAGMLKKQAIDYIQFEYGGCWIDSRIIFLDVYDLLTSFGYIIGKIMPKGIEFYDNYDQRLETFQMANYLTCTPANAIRLKRIHPPLL